MKKKPRHNEIRLRNFKVVAPKSTKTIRVACQWDEQIGEWMMTHDAINKAEATKLKLLVTEAIKGRTDIRNANDFTRAVTQYVLDLNRR
jgi:hypothetical protein